jgi:predicted aspartyl protease/Flp pilus assembly protein TadD
MRRFLLVAGVVGAAYVASSGLGAQVTATPDVQVQLGDLFLADGRYADAQQAYRRAVGTDDEALSVRAGSGLVLALLRTGDFQDAFDVSSGLGQRHPANPTITAMRGDALWSMGRFEEAESSYEAALAADPRQARARHGRARSLAARNRLADALSDAEDALQLNSREAEFHHTLASIHERLRHFDEAARSLSSYIDLLPDKDRSEKAAWARAEIRFLESFRGRVPFEIDTPPAAGVWTMPIRIRGDKVTVAGKVNGGSQEFLLDTGAERTVISLEVARRRGVVPITSMQTAGVGAVGLRGLEVGRIETLEIGGLKVRNVPCLIKNPPLGGLPAREPESFSPLALGLSMRLDYERRLLTIGRSLEPGAYTNELPLRMYRLAFVRGTVNGSLPATFVVDTGGELISISDATAGQIRSATPFRRIPLRVYGTSGWDKDAFLMPDVDLEFSTIRFTGIPVVVLNLRAPSALLGFQLGGIVGHRFLSKYRVTIDMDRSVVGLETQ